MRQVSFDQFGEYSAQEAATLGHFFSERRNDLDDLSTSREIRAYFENKSLGMSKQYGLWASQVGMFELLAYFVAKKQLTGKRIYQRIAFVDQAGDLLADNWGVPEDSLNCTVVIPPDLKPEEVRILLEEKEGVINIILMCPYAYKGDRVGTLLAWLNTEEIMPILMEDLWKPGEKGFCFLVYENIVYSPLQALPPRLLPLINSCSSSDPGEVLWRSFPLESGDTAEVLLVRSLVKGTPFSLFNMVRKEQVLGSMAPWKLLLYTVLLALLLLGGGVIILRISARNLILNVRVDEAVKHTQRIEEKNRQLEAEIGARKMAEEALRKVNDELEARVVARTSALEDRTLALSHEVTERREAEAGMRLIFNSTHDAIIIHNVQGKILDINQRMLDLYQVSRSEAFILSFVDDFSAPGNTVEECLAMWQRVVDGEKAPF